MRLDFSDILFFIIILSGIEVLLWSHAPKESLVLHVIMFMYVFYRVKIQER